MSELKFKKGCKVYFTEQVWNPDGDDLTREGEGILHSIDSDGVFVEVECIKGLKLLRKSFVDVYIKLDKGE